MRRRRADPENSPRRLCGVARSLVAHNRRLCRVLDALPARHVFDHDERGRRGRTGPRSCRRPARRIGLLPRGHTATYYHHRGAVDRHRIGRDRLDGRHDRTARNRPTGDPAADDDHSTDNDHPTAYDDRTTDNERPHDDDGRTQRRATTFVAAHRGRDDFPGASRISPGMTWRRHSRCPTASRRGIRRRTTRRAEHQVCSSTCRVAGRSGRPVPGSPGRARSMPRQIQQPPPGSFTRAAAGGIGTVAAPSADG